MPTDNFKCRKLKNQTAVEQHGPLWPDSSVAEGARRVQTQVERNFPATGLPSPSEFGPAGLLSWAEITETSSAAPGALWQGRPTGRGIYDAGARP